jgi:hypothetical protein
MTRHGWMVLALAAAASASASGCGGEAAFRCQLDSQCVHSGVAGGCEASGYCSFPDPSCPDGRRYGEFAPSDLANQCVDRVPVDAGAPDSPLEMTVTLTPVADTWINEMSTGNNYGTSSELHASGLTSQRGYPLLQFDLSTIPPSAHVTSATLSISTSNGAGLGQGTTQAFPLLESWSEGTQNGAAGAANWTERMTGVPWTTVGASDPGSRDVAKIGEFTPSSGNTRYTVALTISAIQGWVTDPTGNHGLILVNSASTFAVVDFTSRDNIPPKRPQLIVIYTP